MKKNNCLIIVLPILIAIIYIIYIWKNWSNISTSFNVISISDVFDNIITLFIGVVIAFVFGIYYTNKHKQYEIINCVIDMYLDDLKYIMKRIQSVIIGSDPYEKDKLSKELQHLLRISSNDLGTFGSILSKCSYKESDIAKYKNQFFEFKISLTNRQFESKEQLGDSLEEITRCYYTIKNDVHILKLSFYK